MNGGSSRRSLLKYGATVGAVAAAGCLSDDQAAFPDEMDAAVRFEAQRTDGESIVLDELRTGTEGVLSVATVSFEVIASERFPAGTDLESHTVDLDGSLAESQQLHAVLADRDGEVVAGDTAAIQVGTAEPTTVTIEDQKSNGESIEVAYLRTDLDSSLFVFDENGEEIGGSGVTFDAGDEVESLVVDLEKPLSSSQEVRVKLYESNGGPIAEDTAYVEVSDVGEPTVTIQDQESDGQTVEVAYLWTDLDSSLFVFDENGEVVGGSGVTFDAGDEVESLVVDLEEPLTTSQRVRATLYESNAGPIAEDTAYVEVH